MMTSGHEEHEWDFITMFQRLGLDVCAPSVYGVRANPSRGQLDVGTTKDDYYLQEQIYDAIWGTQGWVKLYGEKGNDPFRDAPTIDAWTYDRARTAIEHFAKKCDFGYGFITLYAGALAPHMPFILHLNGQMSKHAEFGLQCLNDDGALVVSYSKSQAALFSSKMPVIHFGRDPDTWKGWTGHEGNVLYVANQLESRRDSCHMDLFTQTRPGDNWVLGGRGNESLGESARFLSYTELQAQMRASSVFFNLGTHPAPYTLAPVEAAMTGMPVVTPAYDHGDPIFPRFELDKILGKGCLVLNSPSRADLESLMGNTSKAVNRREKMGRRARAAAIKHFGRATIDAKWRKAVRGYVGSW
jgi:hypothetical protein